jgi:hypothetical protein
MTENGRKNLTAKMKSTSKEIAGNKKRAKELLMKAGICTRSGALRKAYK